MLLKDFLVQGVGFDSDLSEGVNGTQFDADGSVCGCTIKHVVIKYIKYSHIQWTLPLSICLCVCPSIRLSFHL